MTIQMDFIKWANPDPGFIGAVYTLIERNAARVNAEGFDFLRTQMNFYNRRDFRVETAVNLLERWDCVAGDVRRRNLQALQPPSGELVDAELFSRRIKGQHRKLLEMVRLTHAEGDLKQVIYRYFRG